MPGWRSGYRVSLENLFPQGFAGSNPAQGVFIQGFEHPEVVISVPSVSVPSGILLRAFFIIYYFEGEMHVICYNNLFKLL